jgi:hypothetical protein
LIAAEALAPQVGVEPACGALGVSHATFYRRWILKADTVSIFDSLDRKGLKETPRSAELAPYFQPGIASRDLFPSVNTHTTHRYRSSARCNLQLAAFESE